MDLDVVVVDAVPWVDEEVTQDHDLIGRHVVVGVVEVVEAGVTVKLLAADAEPSILGLVVELNRPAAVDSLRRDAVVLGDADAASEDVTRRRADLHGEGTRVDDGEPAERRDIGARTQPLDAVHALGDIVGLLRGHGHLEGKLLVAEHEGGRRRAPEGEDRLGLLDEDVKSVGVLLQEAVQIDELTTHLGIGLVGGAVLLRPRLGVRRRCDEGDMDIEIVGVLNGANQLPELVLEVLTALGAHHEVVLHGDGKAMAHEIGLVGALGLGEGAGRGLVGDPGGEALVKGPRGPGELLVGVFNVLVGQDEGGEGGTGGIGDEAVDAVREVGIGSHQGLGKLQAIVSLAPVGVKLDISSCGAKNVLIILDGRLIAVARVGPPSILAGVSIGDVAWVRDRSAFLRAAFHLIWPYKRLYIRVGISCQLTRVS